MFSPSQQSLLRAIGQAGPLSRSQLAGATGLSKAAVTGLARGLLDRGLLRPVETVYGAGRPSVRLGIHPGGAYFAGCSIAADGSPAVLANLAGEVVAQAALPPAGTAEAIGRGLRAVLPGLLAQAGVGWAQLGGVGVALSGYVDGAGDRLVRSTLLGWVDVPAARLVAAELGLPTTVENDTNALAVGETLFGVARKAGSFSLVALGEGIGGAHVIDGALVRGHRGGAGEIAHLTLEPGGLPCPCGKRGCVDTVASLRAIALAAERAGLPAHLAGLERAGTPEAAAILRRAGEALGMVMAHVVQMLDPGLIVLAHPAGALGGVLGRAVRDAFAANLLPQLRDQTALLPLPTSPAMLARGAASLAAQAFLQPGGEGRA